MRLAIIGLGRMGLNMSRRLLQGGHEVAVYNRSPEPVKEAVSAGGIPLATLAQVMETLTPPRVVWLMLPAGEITENHLNTFAEMLSPGDVLIDGGNSNFNDTQRRAKMLEPKGLHFVDVGTSGGVWGLTEGYSLMVGGSAEAVAILRPALETLAPAPDKGWGHVGPSGAGHYVKMVHNGIEYGMMQAYAEGFEVMKARKDMGLDLHQIGQIWQQGSVVRSWLLDLTVNALQDDPNLPDIKGWVADSGEGRWTVIEAMNQDVPAPVITLALQMRFVSRQEERYAAKLLAAMRNQFGGHAIKKPDEK
ncbi:MAG: decarboxylating 6-phosphogluconate dehydrogenase [Anaerolineae bacterium]|nr:decarboxylating 6-phosphogluconate dehydrogenase [Anaerolineae bacterium]CAG1002236.1 6-phosphogluconate dehydrogenase [Anaerolineae bacterium]